MLLFNETNIGDIFFGEDNISEVYMGDDLIWEKDNIEGNSVKISVTANGIDSSELYVLGPGTDPSYVLKMVVNGTDITPARSISAVPGETYNIDIYFPEDTTRFSSEAFASTEITSITIPSEIREFGTDVFNGCPYLTEITSKASQGPWVDLTTFRGLPSGGTLNIPNSTLEDYEDWFFMPESSANGNRLVDDLEWNIKPGLLVYQAEYYFPRGGSCNIFNPGTPYTSTQSQIQVFEINGIPQQTFNNTISASEGSRRTVRIVFKANATFLESDGTTQRFRSRIPNNSFQNVDNLYSISQLPLWVTKGENVIGDYAFAGTIGLSAFIEGGSLPLTRKFRELGAHAFDESSLVNADQLEVSHKVGDSCFSNSEINGIPIFDGPAPVIIGAYAFSNCNNLTSIDIDAQEIKEGAFEGCSYLSAVYLRSSVSHICSYAFSGCTRLNYIGLEEKLVYNARVSGIPTITAEEFAFTGTGTDSKNLGINEVDVSSAWEYGYSGDWKSFYTDSILSSSSVSGGWSVLFSTNGFHLVTGKGNYYVSPMLLDLDLDDEE